MAAFYAPCGFGCGSSGYLLNTADVAKVQEWLGHANIATTRLYDRRKHRPENSPTFTDPCIVLSTSES
jgi:integrase